MDDFNDGQTTNNTGKSLVTAKGTSGGLVIRLNASAETTEILCALKDYVSARKSFLEGNNVSLEWNDGIPSEQTVSAITNLLQQEFHITVRRSDVPAENQATRAGSFIPTRSSSAKSSGLFGGIESIADNLDSRIDIELENKPRPQSPSAEKAAPVNSVFWDNPDAMIMHATLRSGQKIETEHSLVLIGDVNFGAEIIAGGDIVVLGKLRGVVHAGAYDETGGGRFIFSLDLQPTQLRIGSIISRGSETSKTIKVPEIAFVDSNAIVVEAYNSRVAAGKMQG